MKKILSALCAVAVVALAGPASADWSKKAADDTAGDAKKAVK
jgi:hypothetical protein